MSIVHVRPFVLWSVVESEAQTVSFRAVGWQMRNMRG
jgi:hypothetical protein